MKLDVALDDRAPGKQSLRNAMPGRLHGSPERFGVD
jgi:hypothetical protein